MTGRRWRFRGDLLARVRVERGLSRPELAELIGVTAPAVRDWERGRTFPQLDHLTAAMDALDVGPDALFTAEDT